MSETTDEEREMGIRKWILGQYPPDFPPMDGWSMAIKFLLRRLDETRAELSEEHLRRSEAMGWIE